MSTQINSAIAAFIKSTQSKKLTLIDLYEKKEVVDVSTALLDTISEFFKDFSRYDIPLQVPVEVTVAKKLLEYVQGQCSDLDNENIASYYKLACLWKMDVAKKACFEKVKTINSPDYKK